MIKSCQSQLVKIAATMLAASAGLSAIAAPALAKPVGPDIKTPAETPKAMTGFDLSQPLTAPGKPLSFRRARSGETITPPPGWTAEIFARNLGDISAICGGASGSIYVLGSKKGRLYELSDRQSDGKLDMQRILASGLDGAQDMACHEGGLFIAAQNGILRYDLSSRQLAAFVPLRNLGARPAPRRLLLDEKHGQLYFAFSEKPGTHRLVAIDLTTAQARNIAEGTGEVTALAQSGASPLWAAISGKLAPLGPDGFDMEGGAALAPGAVVTDLILPGTYEGPEALSPWAQHIFTAQSGTRQSGVAGGPVNIASLPSRFGQVQPRLHIFAGGFTGADGQSAWGQPSAMMIDPRGLFIAERRGGAIWRVYPSPKTTSAPRQVKIYSLENEYEKARIAAFEKARAEKEAREQEKREVEKRKRDQKKTDQKSPDP